MLRVLDRRRTAERQMDKKNPGISRAFPLKPAAFPELASSAFHILLVKILLFVQPVKLCIFTGKYVNNEKLSTIKLAPLWRGAMD